MARYSKLIECSYCGKSFKTKKERNKRKYLCPSYDNKKECVRIPISEKWLDELIEMRFRKKLSDQEIKKEIDLIKVDKQSITIQYKNDSEPTIITNTYAQF